MTNCVIIFEEIGLFEHWIFVVFYYLHFFRRKLCFMNERCVDSFEHYLFTISCRFRPCANFCFKIIIADICIFSFIFLQPPQILLIQNWQKHLAGHFIHYTPSVSQIFRPEPYIIDNFLISKKVKLFEKSIFIIWVVDCSNFPTVVG